MLTRPRVLLAIFFAALTALAAFAGPASAHTYSAKIVVKHPPAFYGQLKSSKGFCKFGREVDLYEERPGGDQLIYSDTTDRSAEWTLPVGNTPGSYYVQAPPTSRCKTAASRVITLY